MFLLLLLAGIFIFGKIGNLGSAKLKLKVGGPCKLHTWEYGEDGFLYCSTCKAKPGYEGRGPGGYE